jgi:hypothetical protein
VQGERTEQQCGGGGVGTSPEPTGAVAVVLRADLEEERGRGRRCASLGSLPPHWARRVIKAGGQRSVSGVQPVV